jgi:glycosyltransferase involved in cell wall biosynthesis
MRIGIVTGEYPPMEGGVGDFTRKLAIELCGQNHDVHILTKQFRSTSRGGDRPQEEPVIHHRIHTTDWRIIQTIRRWIHDISPDALNLQYQAAAYDMRGGLNWYPWFHRYKSLPVVVTYHDLLPPYLFPKAGQLRPWSVRFLAQQSDGIITTNIEDQHHLTQTFSLPQSKIRIIPIGSNIEPSPSVGFTPDQWRKTHGVAKNELLLGFFGFINRSKGIETLLTALASLVAGNVPVKLVFIGGRTGSSDPTNKEYAQSIDARILELGLTDHIEATGFTSASEVSAALLSLDLCILPYKEGASLRHGTLHAALKHGNAIITTEPSIHIPQLKHGENCYLIPPENPEALEYAIRTLAQQPRILRALGRGAEALAQSFSWRQIAKKTSDFLKDLK